MESREMRTLGERKTFFLVNPIAGARKSREKWESLLPLLTKEYGEFAWEYTENAGSAAMQTRRALDNGFNLIMAVGGDGTAHEVLNGFLKDGVPYAKGAVLGVWHLGTGGDFARMLYRERSPEALLSTLKQGIVSYTDVGFCECADDKGGPVSCYYLNSFDIGIGADTAYEVNSGSKKMGGKLTFMLTAVKCLFKYKYVHMDISAKTQSMSGYYSMVSAGNGCYAGGGMQLTPHASLEDGLLDLMLVNKSSRLKLLSLIPSVYKGGHIKSKLVQTMQVAGFDIRTKKPLTIECDGETVGYTDARVRILPKVLLLLKPCLTA